MGFVLLLIAVIVMLLLFFLRPKTPEQLLSRFAKTSPEVVYDYVRRDEYALLIAVTPKQTQLLIADFTGSALPDENGAVDYTKAARWLLLDQERKVLAQHNSETSFGGREQSPWQEVELRDGLFISQLIALDISDSSAHEHSISYHRIQREKDDIPWCDGYISFSATRACEIH